MNAARLARLAPFLAGALVTAGIVHILAILLVPQVGTRNAAQRLGAGAPLHAVVALDPVLSAADPLPLPFADPAAVTALCRFSLAEGPVRLVVPTGENIVSVVILSASGRVLLALTDRAATRRQLNFLLVTPEQQRRLEAEDPEDEPVQDLRLRLGERAGVAVLRTVALRPWERRASAAALGRASCRQETPPEG